MLISWWPLLIGCWALLIKALRFSWPACPGLSRDSLGKQCLPRQFMPGQGLPSDGWPSQGLPSQARYCKALRRSQPSTALVCVCILIGFCCFAAPLAAAPGLCLGPVCGDEFSRNPQFPWQLRLRVSDQSGQRERLVVDCRDGVISPRQGPVERGYAAAVARRACRLAPSSPSPAEPEMLPTQLPIAALKRSSAPWP
jgi:hypothetical protein